MAFLLSLALLPSVAFAASPAVSEAAEEPAAKTAETAAESGAPDAPAKEVMDTTWYLNLNAISYTEMEAEAQAAHAKERTMAFQDVYDRLETEMEKRVHEANKVLPYSRDELSIIGTQESTGHTICCPSFSCAYADAILDGTVNSHYHYGCSNCRWADWGGGNSSYRDLGSSQALLREAYDEISAGRPTVVHVSASYGQHWITLIGYQNAVDPDDLTLSNFIALDPWDGSELVAGSRFRLYGDNCQHVSSRFDR